MSGENKTRRLPQQNSLALGATRTSTGKLNPTPQFNPSTDDDGVTRTSSAPSASVVAHGGNMSPEHDWGAFDRAFVPNGGREVSEAGGLWGLGASKPSAAPQVGATRRTSTGNETLMPSQSGARWVANVMNAPAMNNAMPGQSASASMPERRVVDFDAAPSFARDRDGVPVTSAEQIIARNREFYAGGMGKRTVATTASPRNWWEASADSPRIQAQLNNAVPGASQARTAIAANGGREGGGMTPYGPVWLQSAQGIAARNAAAARAPLATIGASPATAHNDIVARPNAAAPSPVAAGPMPAVSSAVPWVRGGMEAGAKAAGPLAGGVPLQGATLPKIGNALVQGAKAPGRKPAGVDYSGDAARARRAAPAPKIDVAGGAKWLAGHLPGGGPAASAAANLVTTHPNTRDTRGALWLRNLTGKRVSSTNGAINSPRVQLGQ